MCLREDLCRVGKIYFRILDHLRVVGEPELSGAGSRRDSSSLGEVHMTVVNRELRLPVLSVGRLGNQKIGILCRIDKRIADCCVSRENELQSFPGPA